MNILQLVADLIIKKIESLLGEWIVMIISDFYPGDIIKEIPHELKGYGRIQLEKYLRDDGYIIIPNGIIDRDGYFIFKEMFVATDIQNPCRFKYLGWRRLLEKAIHEVKTDYNNSIHNFEINVMEVYDECN